jgi:hypothetical protein
VLHIDDALGCVGCLGPKTGCFLSYYARGTASLKHTTQVPFKFSNLNVDFFSNDLLK